MPSGPSKITISIHALALASGMALFLASTLASCESSTTPRKENASMSSAYQALISAIEADSESGIEQALAQGADINQPLPNSATPLMWAIAKKKPVAVRVLLTRGANVHAKDRDGDNPVTVAARFAGKDDLSILRMVLEAGGDPNSKRPDGDPVLNTLAMQRNLSGIKLLSAHKANVNAFSRTKTPLILEAALSEDWDVVFTFIESGAEVNVSRGRIRLLDLIGDHAATPPDSPLWPWKIKVWQHLKARGIAVPPLPAEK